MRILLLGDTHGNPRAIQYAYSEAVRHNVDRIFQLGDYGYWEHKKGGPEYLQVTSEFATLNNIPFYWLDGNHENHSWLRMKSDQWMKLQYDAKHAPAAPYSEAPTKEGFWPIRPNLFYSPRGNRFEWDGVKFMTFGGAYSIDRTWRTIGDSWWWEEEIELDEVKKAVDGPPVDVLLSHDLPNGVDIKLMMAKRGVDYKNIPESERGRLRLRTVVEGVQPKFIYHGHYHTNYVQWVTDWNYGEVRVQGLDCDESGKQSWTIFDTEEFHGTKKA